MHILTFHRALVFAGMAVEVYAFKPSLAPDMQEAELIISHAGAGCIMESLRHDVIFCHSAMCHSDDLCLPVEIFVRLRLRAYANVHQ
jgi:hypothetical protein